MQQAHETDLEAKYRARKLLFYRQSEKHGQVYLAQTHKVIYGDMGPDSMAFSFFNGSFLTILWK